MLIKKYLKIILIIFSSFSSLALLFVLGMYLYFFNENNFSLVDKKGYLSNFISWYIDKEIKLKTISIKKNDFNSKYKIKISDFESFDYKNFSEIKVQLISFECHFIECIRSYKNFSNVNLVNPTLKVLISDNENYDSSSYYEDLLNFIDKANITKVEDGNVNIHYLKIINEFSGINLIKTDRLNDLSIMGDFNYRTNKSKKISNFNIEISKSEYKSFIDIKFSSFSVPQFIYENYNIYPIFFKDTLIDGDIRINIQNGIAKTIDFKIISNNGNIILKKNNFKNILFKDIYNFKNLDFNGTYIVDNAILDCKKFDISIDVKNYLNAKISLKGFTDLEVKKNNLNVNVDYYNLIPKNIISIDNDNYDELLLKEYSGKSSFNIIDSEIKDINIYINDVLLNNLSFQNIIFTKYDLFTSSELEFKIKGKYENLIPYIEEYNIYDLNYFDKINGDLYSNIKFIIPSKFKSISEVKYKIKGSVNNIIYVNSDKELLFDVENLELFNFDIDNFNDNEYVNVNKLELVFFTENKNLNSYINVEGSYKYTEEKYNLNFDIIFENFLVKNVNEYSSNYININSSALISGKSEIIVKDSNIENISLDLQDFNFGKIFISNINFLYENKNNFSKINFQTMTQLRNFISLLNGRFLNEDNNVFSLNKLTGKLNSNIEIILDGLHIIDIKVNGSLANIENSDGSNFINKLNVNLIKKLDFNFRNNKSKSTFYGVAEIFDSNFNFSYIKNNSKNIFNTNFIIDNKIRNILNYNPDMVKGDVGYNIDIYKEGNEWSYKTEINYLQSSIIMSSIKYEKSYDKFSKLYLYGILNNNFMLENINFEYKDLNNMAYGKIINFINDNLLIDLEAFVYDKNNFSAEINYDFNNKFIIKVNNGTLNLNTFLDSESKGLKNFYISANLDNLLIFNDVIFGKTKLIYDYQDNILNEFSINSKYFGDEDFSLFCSNDGNNSNKNKYELFASDAGKFFKTLNYTTEIMDGVFSSEGYFGEIDDDYNIMGTVSIDNFKVMKAPIFAELLLAASLTGLIEVLENDGIEFEQFDAQYFGKDKIYTISKSRAYGFSLGITGEGTINSNNSEIDIKGSLIPAYKINSVFNNIPIIGEILSGKEDEGLFAINYSTKGNWDNLESEINPLSALTPGLLRNIFDFLE